MNDLIAVKQLSVFVQSKAFSRESNNQLLISFEMFAFIKSPLKTMMKQILDL